MGNFNAAMNSLTELTRKRLEEVFPPSDHAIAASLLEQMTHEQESGLERCHLAALKVSEGRLDELRDAVALYRIDFRDLLVAAGFAEDVTAHLKWT